MYFLDIVNIQVKLELANILWYLVVSAFYLCYPVNIKKVRCIQFFICFGINLWCKNNDPMMA